MTCKTGCFVIDFISRVKEEAPVKIERGVWMILDALLDAAADTAKTLPFLFAAFLVMEALEYYSGHYLNRILSGMGKAGPLAGAVLGCIPQCGFSAAAANLYSGGIITLGTLISVFLSTSDEAVLILLGHPGSGRIILPLLFGKVIIAIAAGYLTDILFRRTGREKHIEDMCRSCGCSDTSGIFKPALIHTLRLAAYLLLFTGLLNLLLDLLGVDALSRFLGKGTLLQPFLAALLGLIPNCASSVLITELYLAGSLDFGAAIAGLCTGAGVGLAVLFRSNRPVGENLKITAWLYGTAVAAGLTLRLLI